MSFLFGRLLYDKYYDNYYDYIKERVDHILEPDVLNLLDNTPVGVYQLGKLLVGPMGLIKSDEERFIPPTLSLPLWYCPDTGCGAIMDMEKVTHPLLKNCVPNTVRFTQNALVTGSNAFGKSTFIKAVAINAILAQTICTCLASRFVMPRCSVVTSMAVRDDVVLGESYYDNGLMFDYRIRQGPAVTKNAIRLLHYMGYEEDIVLRADQLAKNFEKSRAWETL